MNDSGSFSSLLALSPIQSVLAEQVANMLKAKELKKKQEEERQQLIEEMTKIKLEEDNIVIDLMQALQETRENNEECKIISKESDSISSSLESLFEPNFIDCDEFPELLTPAEPLLPCKTDMSYILDQKIRKARCSAFGKVLTSRVRPVAAPYLREAVESTVVRFDFKTQSPCDIIKEKLRKPTCNSTYSADILSVGRRTKPSSKV